LWVTAEADKELKWIDEAVITALVDCSQLNLTDVSSEVTLLEH